MHVLTCRVVTSGCCLAEGHKWLEVCCCQEWSGHLQNNLKSRCGASGIYAKVCVGCAAGSCYSRCQRGFNGQDKLAVMNLACRLAVHVVKYIGCWMKVAMEEDQRNR